MRVFTIGHGTRSASELVETLRSASVETIVDVRRYPSSRRSPHFNRDALAETLTTVGIAYVHEVELGGRRSGEPGQERFGCIQTPAFRSYAARMSQPTWQKALERVLESPAPCMLCAETPWWRCHRRLIAELLAARGHEVVHLLRPHAAEPHRRWDEADYLDGRLYICGQLVA